MLVQSTQAMLAEQHLDQLAFGWKQRSRLLKSHVTGFAGLLQRDQAMLEAARALSALPSASQKVIEARLQDQLAAADMFAITVHAVGHGHKALHDLCTGLMQAMPHLRQAYVAALEWVAPQRAGWACTQWITQTGYSAWSQRLVLTACSMHPELIPYAQNSGTWEQVLGALRNEVDPLWALMRCALISGEPQALARAPALLDAGFPGLRGLAAVALLRHPAGTTAQVQQHAAEVLLALAIEEGPHARTWLQSLAVLRLQAFDDALAAVASSASQRHLYLEALGWSGDARAVPKLMDALAHPQHARIAGAALAMLTGSLPARDGWQADVDPKAAQSPDREADDTHIPKADPDADLPVPDKAGFARWWSAHRQRFAAPAHYLAGQPLSTVHLLSVLQHGRQAWRVMAADLLDMPTGMPLLNTSAPARQQQLWLHTYFSKAKHHDHHA